MNFFKYVLVFSCLFVGINCFSQDYCMTSPVGFGRNATGGGNGKVVTVKTHSELKAALKASGSSVIIVANDITFGEGSMISEVVTNKTLLGLKGVKLVSTARVNNGGILGLKEGSNNVIIRNLIFEGPGAFDVDGKDLLQNTGCTNLWVDHCEFYDGVDGNFDNTKKADNITISWCKFGYRYPSKVEGMTGDGSGEHRYSNLIGGGSSDYPNDGFYSITFQYCYWGDGCAQRMPRARNAELHILNCYYNVTNVSSALAIGLGAGSKGTTCYVEGTNFKKVGKVVDRSYDPVSGKTVAVNFVDCLKGGSSAGTVSKPSYSYTALDVNQVEAAVTSSCGAGATLTITAGGEISSSCSSQLPLTVPKNVNADNSASNSIIINWDEVEGATGYRVKICYENEGSGNNTVLNEWDFSSWTINAGNADANLVLDKDNPVRFNYKPSTSSEALKFASGKAIPDVEGLKFTAGADTKLRLGFESGMIYLNGSNITVKIPCSVGDYVVIKGMSGNATATDRGFSVKGATVDASGTSANISGGVISEAGAAGTWSYIATSDVVELTTLNGGMNITKIIVSSDGMSSSVKCDEYDTVDATKTISNLTEGKEYTYQVKALRGDEETLYSTAQSIVVENLTLLEDVLKEKDWTFMQTPAQLIVSGLEVDELSLYNSSGNKVMNITDSQVLTIDSLPSGFYVLVITTTENAVISKKIIK